MTHQTRTAGRLATALLVIATWMSSPMPSLDPAPALHPNLLDAQQSGFALLVGRAPFTVRLWTEHARGWRHAWDGGGGSVLADGQPSAKVRFEHPGVYYPAVTVSLPWGPAVKLKQKIVVLDALPAASAPGRYGVNQDLAWDPADHVETEIDLMKAAGLQWVRMPIRWRMVMPRKDLERWKIQDQTVDASVSADLKILAVLDAVPVWWKGARQFDAARLNDFARYAHTVADHYRGRIGAYEILNEPNSSAHWPPRPDAHTFVQFLCAGYYAVKYADPANVVVVGGLNGNGLFLGWETSEGRDFLKTIYDSPARACFDVMAIHPFAHPIGNKLSGLQAWVDQARAYMRSQDDSRELWLTETGWSTGQNLWGHPTITEETQAAWVVSIYRDLRGPEKIFWYNFKDTEPNSNDPEHQWGWVFYDLELKPAYQAFADLRK
jgi:hypothetical protein